MRLNIVLIFLLILFCGNTIIADPVQSTQLTVEEREELLEELLSPIAIERAIAAIKLQGHITQRELERWFYGYDERYREDGIIKNRHIEKDWLILTNYLAGGWPKEADFLLDAFIELNPQTPDDNQYLYVFSGFLFDYKKYKNIDKDAPINVLLRDDFYKDYRTRISGSMLWKEKYQYIANTPWLKEKALADKDWFAYDDKLIIKYFAGELTEEDCNESEFGKLLYNAVYKGIRPQIDIGREYNIMKPTDYALIIATLLDRTDWFQPIQDDLKSAKRTHVIWVQDKWEWVETEEDCSNPVFKAIIHLLNNNIDECKSILEDIIYNDSDFDTRVILHHYLFDNLRNSDGFKEWFEDLVHRWDIIDPDPAFKSLNWHP